MKIHLDKDIFELVKCGKKDVEVRIYDEKRKKLKIGDSLIFISRLDGQTIDAIVTDLVWYDSFESLTSNYSIDRLYAYGYTKKQFIDVLRRFYTKEEEQENGVLAIHFVKC